MTVFVGGTYGGVPTVVSKSLATALRRTAVMHVVPTGNSEPVECDVKWSCFFVDGEPDQLRFTAEAPDGEKLYVELMEISE